MYYFKLIILRSVHLRVRVSEVLLYILAFTNCLAFFALLFYILHNYTKPLSFLLCFFSYCSGLSQEDIFLFTQEFLVVHLEVSKAMSGSYFTNINKFQHTTIVEPIKNCRETNQVVTFCHKTQSISFQIKFLSAQEAWRIHTWHYIKTISQGSLCYISQPKLSAKY